MTHPSEPWTLGFETRTTAGDAGHELVWGATVEPTEVELSAGEMAGDVVYTITSATCEAP